METNIGFGIALPLGLWAFFALVMNFGTTMQIMTDPIVAGWFAGLLIGNVPLGLAIGGTLELMSLGLWMYGGASIPDFMSGAIVGTVFASVSGLPIEQAVVAGIGIAVPVTLVIAQFDMLAFTLVLPFLHAADRFLEQKNERGASLMHILAIIPYAASRGIPVFLAILLGAGPVGNLIGSIPAWLSKGLNVVGSLLPALGFGILLTFLPLKKWWAFFIIGFALFAYLHVPLIGIALLALAIVMVYFSLTPEIKFSRSSETKTPKKASVVTRGDLLNAAWRANAGMEWSWNYERMQALGFTWALMPVLKKIYPNKDEYFAALKRHMVFYNTNCIYGNPTIFGAVCALEENHEGAMGDSLKLSLMGPFAGIGDTLTGVLIRPIVGIFAASLALAGNPLGVVMIVILSLFWFVGKFPGFWFGYNQGLNLVRQATSGVIEKLTEAASMVALVVLGGFVPSILGSVTTPLEVAKKVMVQGEEVANAIKIQGVLDSLLPYMIPLLLVFGVYMLLKKYHLKNVQVLLIIIVVGFVLSLIGIL